MGASKGPPRRISPSGRQWAPPAAGETHEAGGGLRLSEAERAAELEAEGQLARSTGLTGTALVEGGHHRVADLYKVRLNAIEGRRRKARRLLREAELEAQLRATRDSRKPHLEDEDNVFVLVKAANLDLLRDMRDRWVLMGDAVLVKAMPPAPGVVRDAAFSAGVGEDSGINRGDTSGFKPLHCASQAGHVEVAKLLVAPPPKGFGAHLDIVNPVTGETALHAAAAQGHAPMVRFLVGKLARTYGRAGAAAESELGHACHAPREIDVNARDAEGQETALHMAAQRGHVAAAAALIEAGALVCESDR